VLGVGFPLNAWALRYGYGEVRRKPIVAGASPFQPPRAPDHGMFILAFMFTASGMVGIGMATNLPRLFTAIGASPAAAIAAASLFGPAQVAARILEFSARRRIDPLISARAANLLHPLASLTIALGGAPVVAVFSILHGAGNGMLTIARGTLPLALYGPDGYGARIGRLSAPARVGQALAPFLFGLAIERLGGLTLLISSGLSLAALVALLGLALPAAAPADTN
jgi:hypothetical protein